MKEILHESLMDSVYKKARDIAARKEEVLEALIAKYGYQPDEMVVCEQPSTGKFWVEKKNKWISINDMRPEKQQIVLVYGKGHYCVCTFHGEDYWYTYLWTSYDMKHAVTGVTHWMPLPEPPEKECLA